MEVTVIICIGSKGWIIFIRLTGGSNFKLLTSSIHQLSHSMIHITTPCRDYLWKFTQWQRAFCNEFTIFVLPRPWTIQLGTSCLAQNLTSSRSHVNHCRIEYSLHYPCKQISSLTRNNLWDGGTCSPENRVVGAPIQGQLHKGRTGKEKTWYIGNDWHHQRPRQRKGWWSYAIFRDRQITGAGGAYFVVQHDKKVITIDWRRQENQQMRPLVRLQRTRLSR